MPEARRLLVDVVYIEPPDDFIDLSKRFVREALREARELEREFMELSLQIEALTAQIDAIESRQTDIRTRTSWLQQLVNYEVRVLPIEAEIAPTPTDVDRGALTETGVKAVKGADIRLAAGSVLAANRGFEPTHYTDWYQLFVEAGYRISSADAQAVFLTQIARMPGIIKTDDPGVYRLNPNIVEELTEQLSELNTQLNNLPDTTEDPSEILAISQQRVDLSKKIALLSRQLVEAMKVMRTIPETEPS